MDYKLENLIDNSRTDKNTRHCYLELYENLLSKYKYTATNILEIGIGPHYPYNTNGGSIKLWHDYFIKAEIFAVDIIPLDHVTADIKNNPRIHIVLGDAYDPRGFPYDILSKIRYDFVLDDGPHTLDSMIRFICMYFPLVVDGGLLIIEDLQDISWSEILKQHVPEPYRNNIQCHDFRHIRNKHDDIVFVVFK